MTSSRMTRLGASALLSLVLASGLTAVAFGATPTDPPPGPIASSAVTATPSLVAAPTSSATKSQPSSSLAGCRPPGWNPNLPWPGCTAQAWSSTKAEAAKAAPATTVTHSITGTVTGPSSTPLVGIGVEAYSPAYGWFYDNTIAGGAYSLDDLPAGSYTVDFYDFNNVYLHGYYDSGVVGAFTTSYNAATPVPVGSADVPGINVELPTGYYIRGTVTSGGSPVQNIEVDANSTGYSGFTTTNASGIYAVLVPNGTYTLVFTDPDGTYLHGYYDSGVVGGFTTNASAATPVPVNSGDATGKDVHLQTGLHIRGTVTGTAGALLHGIWVYADSSTYNGYATTDSSGIYSILVPASGSYTVFFTDGTYTYLAGYYSSGGFTTNAGSATLVPVGSSSDTTGINVQMVVAPPWSVTLAASATTVPFGAEVTLTATASEDVGATPYYIVILASNGDVLHYCGGGTTCSTPVNSSGPASRTFHAIIGHIDGTSPVATYAPVTVTWANCGTYVPITPVRVLDTRNGTGLSGKLSANTPATFQVTGTHVPSGAIAVTGNVTVVNSSYSWAVYLGPNPVASPTTSTINFAAGQVTGNGLTVALSGTGSLSATYMSSAGNTTDLVFDVTGYFLPNLTGDTYHAIAPARMLDTRTGNGLGARLHANTPATFQVAGRLGVPSNATAVTGNVTVVNPSFSWAVYLGPDPLASPTTSTINFNTGEIKGNSLTVSLSGAGNLSATFMSSAGNTTDLVFDVTGFYTADSSGAVFVPIDPVRMLDTRVANGLGGKLAANTPATFSVAGRPGVPSNAIAVTGNVTVVNETFSWAVFLGPDPIASPPTSTINFNLGDIKGNGLTVALSGGGSLSATYMSNAGNTTDLVFDVTGYYVSCV
jgi:hypothetical protein